MANQLEQAKGPETAESIMRKYALSQERALTMNYRADEVLEMMEEYAGVYFDQQHQPQPGIKQWVSEGDLYRESEVRLIAARFARESRLKHDVTSNDTITTFDAWFNKENFVQAYLPNSTTTTTTPKSDMISKEKVIDILDEHLIFSDKVIAKSSNQIIQECITKIKEI